MAALNDKDIELLSPPRATIAFDSPTPSLTRIQDPRTKADPFVVNDISSARMASTDDTEAFAARSSNSLRKTAMRRTSIGRWTRNFMDWCCGRWTKSFEYMKKNKSWTFVSATTLAMILVVFAVASYFKVSR